MKGANLSRHHILLVVFLAIDVLIAGIFLLPRQTAREAFIPSPSNPAKPNAAPQPAKPTSKPIAKHIPTKAEEIVGEPEVRGVVTDDSGNPIGGATVRAIQADSGAKKADAAGVTNKDGSYVLKGLKFDCPYPYKVVASAPGFAPTPSELFFSRRPPKELNIKLEKGVPIKGKVVTTDGQGIEGATVMLIESAMAPFEMSIYLYTDLELNQTAQTGVEGEYTIPHAGVGEYWLYVQAETFFDGIKLVSVSPTSGPQGADFTLEHAGVIRLAGTVYDEKTQLPIEGAMVAATLRIGSGPGGRYNSIDRTCYTARDGRFFFRGLPHNVNITANKRAYSRKEVNARGETGQDLKVYLRPYRGRNSSPGTVTGRVFDALSLEPIKQFRVAVLRKEIDYFWGERSFCIYSKEFDSPDGSFSIRDMEQGIVNLLVNAAGYGTQVARGQALPEGHSDRTYVSEIGLKSEATAAGVVSDRRTGHPIAGALVTLNCDWNNVSPVPLSGGVFTDALGRYELRALPEGPHRLIARHPGYVPAISDEINFSPAEMLEGINLSPGVGGSIEGKIDDEYREQAGVVVHFQLVASPVLYQHVSGGMPLDAFLSPSRAAQTDEHGRFRIDGLTPGYYLASTHFSSGDSTKFNGIFSVDVKRVIETREGKTTTYDIPACGGRIEGKVLFDKADEPDLNAGRGYYVYLRKAHAPPLDLTAEKSVLEVPLQQTMNNRYSDYWGFRFTGVCGGEYTITVLRYERDSRNWLKMAEQKSAPVKLRDFGKADLTIDFRKNDLASWTERGREFFRSLVGDGKNKSQRR